MPPGMNASDDGDPPGLHHIIDCIGEPPHQSSANLSADPGELLRVTLDGGKDSPHCPRELATQTEHPALVPGEGVP